MTDPSSERLTDSVEHLTNSEDLSESVAPHPTAAAQDDVVQPRTGARVELRRVDDVGTSERAVYEGAWSTDEHAWPGRATVTHGGEVSLDFETSPPQWLRDWTHNLLRSLARNARDGGSWPRRLTRWRAIPSDR